MSRVAEPSVKTQAKSKFFRRQKFAFCQKLIPRNLAKKKKKNFVYTIKALSSLKR